MYNINLLLDRCRMALDTLFAENARDMVKNASRINAVLNMLADDDSRETYVSDLCLKTLQPFVRDQQAAEYTGNMPVSTFTEGVKQAKSVRDFDKIAFIDSANCSELKYHDIASVFLFEQYSYKDTAGVREGDVCLDCGACLGDAALYFINRNASRVYSFEIDRENLTSLEKTFKAFGVEKLVETVPMALGERDGEMFYTPPALLHGSGTVTAAAKEGSYKVTVTTIDSFCSERKVKPDFIKMDIEGSELAALKGAKDTIVQCRPQLAVSIYHSVPNRWEIPLLVWDWLPGPYSFYIKKSQPLTETVLFAVPE